MEWQDRVVVDPNILAGKPVIKGTLPSRRVYYRTAGEWLE